MAVLHSRGSSVASLAPRDPVRVGTARITVTALGLVLGLSASAVLPLLLPWQGLATLAAISVLCALLPFAGLFAAWRALPASFGWLAAAAASASALLLLPLWSVYRGELRVLNLGDEPFALWIDGQRLGRVEPSSGESARAGIELTVPAGERALRVVSEPDGRELFVTRQRVHGGSPHLFAPLNTGYCFFIERRRYGDGHAEPLESEPLVEGTSFWVLPDGISWFTPNPEPGPLQTSGGTLSCLRQRRCGAE
jgi:hypothetical protein